MASKQINIDVNSKSTGKGFESAAKAAQKMGDDVKGTAKDLDKLGTAGEKAGEKTSQGLKKISYTMEGIRKDGTKVSYTIDGVAKSGAKIGDSINKGATTARISLGRLKQEGDRSASGLRKSFSDVGKSIGTDVGKGAERAGQQIDKGIGGGSTRARISLGRLKSEGTQTGSALGTTFGHVGSTIGNSIAKGAQTGTNALGKLGQAGRTAGSSISKGMSSATSSMDGLGTALTGLLGGFGAMQLAQQAWTGATQAQFSQAELAIKVGDKAAKQYVATIQDIVAEVPGDDSFMNQILTGSLAAQTNLTGAELKALANGVADYSIKSKAIGKSMIETQQDLKEYITTGNTSQLERDSILKSQLGTLEGQKTVSARIVALNKALAEAGYKGLSQLQVASIKLEEITGKFQSTLTKIGGGFLIIIEPLLDVFLTLDEKTKGLSTTFITIAAALGLIGVAGIALLPVFGEISVALLTLTGEATVLGAISSIALGPIGIAILGISAAVAAGIYIWGRWSDQITNTIGKIKSGDWSGAGQNIVAAFKWVGGKIYNILVNIPSMIGNAAGSFVDLGSKFIKWLITGLNSVDNWLNQIMAKMLDPTNAVTSAGKKTGDYFGKGLVDWLINNGPKIASNIWNMFTKVIPKIAIIGFKIIGLFAEYTRQGLVNIGASIGKINWLGLLGKAASQLVKWGSQFWGWIVQGLTGANAGIDTLLSAAFGGSSSGGTGASSGASGGKAKTAGQAAGKSWLQGLIEWVTANGPTIINTLYTIFARVLPLLGMLAIKIGILVVRYIVTGLASGAGRILNNLTAPFRKAYSRIMNWWGSLKAYIRSGITGKISILTDAINWARQKYNDLRNYIMGNPIVQKIVSVVTGGGPAGPGQARGPNISRARGVDYDKLNLNYENYAGHQKNAITASNCMSGNCVDMSLGLMAMNEGKGNLVSGTWNGGPHVWYQDPSGKQLDPARKALQNTWMPPARGPGDNGQVIIQQNFQGGVYGDDYIKQVAYNAARQGASQGLTGNSEITGGY